MAVGNLRGRARLSVTSPSAMGVCDRCGCWFNLDDLARQFEWAGANLYDTGYLVCKPKCLDVPFEQNRVLILPPDPVPRTNARPDQTLTPPAYLGLPTPVTPANQGFSVYILGAPIYPLYPTPQTVATGGAFSIGLSVIGIGAIGGPQSPVAAAKAEVLAQVAALSGVPTPPQIIDRSIAIIPANTTLTPMPANATREWLLIYNPTNAQAQFSSGTALWGMTTNLIIGPGEAFFWATSQGNAPVYQGALTAIGLDTGLPLWLFESGDTVLYVTDQFGVPITDQFGRLIPIQ